jgi:hypothetical protein
MLSGRSGSYTRFTELQHDVLATRLPLRSRVGYLQHIHPNRLEEHLRVLTDYIESIQEAKR